MNHSPAELNHRRWFTMALMLVVVTLGAWLILAAQRAERVSVRLLGYETNSLNERSVVLWITNGHHFPVVCRFPAVTNLIRVGHIGAGRVEIEPRSAVAYHVSPEEVPHVPARPWRVEVTAWWLRPFTRTEVWRWQMGEWMRKRRWPSLRNFVNPVNKETVLSEPISLECGEKRE